MSGFELWAVIAEYRALRASVLRLWRESEPTSALHDLDDVTRFNESMDQSLTHVTTLGIHLCSANAHLCSTNCRRLVRACGHSHRDGRAVPRSALDGE